MSAVAKLEALLARVQTNRANPRVVAAPHAPAYVAHGPTPIVTVSPVHIAHAAPAVASPMPTPAPAPRSPFGAATTPTPAPTSPVARPAQTRAEAPTPARGLRTPVPPSPAAHVATPAPVASPAHVPTPTNVASPAHVPTPTHVASPAHVPTPVPAPTSPARHRPTPLEMAVVDEAEHESLAAAPVAAAQIMPSVSTPPSAPIVRIMSDAAVPERATFGGLLRRTLALRPR